MTRAARPRIPPAVWTLGFVSLFTDLGSEIVHSLLPVLLTGVLGASALLLGVIEGVAEGLVLVTRVFSGWLSDAIGRRKPLVLFGYGLAAAVKPLFPLADSVAAVFTARVLDRFGKGVRGAPRDALISEHSPPEVRGASFGLRQSLDSLGAVLGPLAAIGLMVAFADDVRAVLWLAVLPGVAAVALILVAVREPEGGVHPRARLPISRPGLASLGAPFWRITGVAALVSLARPSEAFLILRALERGLAATFAPLVLVVMSAVYTATAYPAGHLSDRVPRTAVLMLGILSLVAADLVLAFASGIGACLLGIALWGAHLGLTQGILASLVADAAPPAHRGTSYGVYGLVSGFGVLSASVIAGAAWDVAGPAWMFTAGAGLATLAFIAAVALPRFVRD